MKSGRILQLDEMVFLIWVFYLLFLVAEDSVFEAILKEYLLLSRVGTDCVIKLKQARLSFEEYLKYNRNQSRRTINCGEFQRYLKLLTGTSVAFDIYFFVLDVVFHFSKRHLDSSKKMILTLNLQIRSMSVGIVNYVAEGSCKRPVELDFGLVFVSAGLVHVCVDETLHWVNVEDVSSDRVVWVWKNFYG